MTDASSGLRIGTTEREAAMAALEAHLVAGRLELDEYGERSAKASVARTADELAALFTDLPLPHAGQPAAPVSLSKPSARQVRQHSTGPLGGPLFGRYGERLVAATPFVAVALFFWWHTWLVFLLIPLAGALVYGNSHGHRDRGQNRRERHERRAQRH